MLGRVLRRLHREQRGGGFLGAALGGFGGGVVGRATVELVGDSAKLRSELNQAKTQGEATTKTLGQRFQAFGGLAKVAMVAAGAAVVKFAADSIRAASDLGEQMNVARAQFEDASGAVIKFADSAENIGIAKSEALEAASAFGGMFDVAGLATEQTAQMSIRMVKLAADMASFRNQDPSDMLDRLRSGLAGEAEPLRRFGVFLNEAAVAAKAVELGIAAAGDELTDGQKIQARYALILEQTTKAHGDFARTLGESMPNQARKASAQIENLQAEIGEALLPAVTQALSAFNDLLDVLDKITGPIARIGEEIDKISLLQFGSEISGAATLVEEFEGALAAALRSGRISIEDLRAALPAMNEQLRGIEYAGQLSAARIIELAGGISTAGAAARETADATRDQADAHREAADAAREEQLALLELSGGLLGIEASGISASDAQRDLRAAQAEVNRLVENGKRGTAEYREALRNLRSAQLDAVRSQLSLREAILQFAQDAAEGGASAREAKDMIREMGRAAGLSKDDIQTLIGRIRDYITAVNDIPKSIVTTISVKGANVPTSVFTGGAQGGIIPAGQAGGITRGPLLIGEGRYPTPVGRGSEALIPLDSRGIGILAKALEKAGGGGGRNLTIGPIALYVDASDVPADGPEFVRRVADALYGMMLDEVRT